VSANDVWAVGFYNITTTQTLVEHWNGTAWSVVSSPNPSAGGDYLYGVAALSGNDVWAVGAYYTGPENQTLVEHWNGSAWNVVQSPNSGSGNNFLYAVGAISAQDIWAVGEYNNGTGMGTLTEHYAGPCSTSSPTSIPNTAIPTGTPTQPIPTQTATRPIQPTQVVTGTATGAPSSTPTLGNASTATRLPSPTSCPIQFTDVPEGSTFYPYIRCLACRGIINGYPDGTFRPNNNVTRGQLSKIVSNAVGFSDPQPDQLFQDVAIGSTFQVYIGRLASRGFIIGYPFGGPGEPCVKHRTKTYFLPRNTATRGQLTKIVSNAEGFNQPVPLGQQTFADVPEGSTYYLYVERLMTNRPGVMSGYPCGGPGEPCDDRQRPYFRPYSSVTRGQTAKIVSNSAFPGCAP
jgi:hypothetical protein